MYVSKLNNFTNKATFGSNSAIDQLEYLVDSRLACGDDLFPLPYGCFCGPNLGSEVEDVDPVDEFDAHCKEHDQCYQDVIDDPGCKHFNVYFSAYNFSERRWLEVRDLFLRTKLTELSSCTLKLM